MSEKLSTGFVNALNTVGSVKGIMDGGTIHIYGGATQPATADLAETGTLLMKITKDGAVHTPGNVANGIVMGLSVDGVLSLNAGDVLKGLGLAAAGSGGILATYYRWYDVDVVTGDSTTAVRLDGAVGTGSTFEMVMVGSTIIVEDAPATINTFTYTTKQA